LKTGLTKNKIALRTKNDKKDVILISTLPYLAFDEHKFTGMQKELEEKMM
jgi:hypothetical protein